MHTPIMTTHSHPLSHQKCPGLRIEEHLGGPTRHDDGRQCDGVLPPNQARCLAEESRLPPVPPVPYTVRLLKEAIEFYARALGGFKTCIHLNEGSTIYTIGVLGLLYYILYFTILYHTTL